jgi:hypothetical protein
VHKTVRLEFGAKSVAAVSWHLKVKDCSEYKAPHLTYRVRPESLITGSKGAFGN